MTGKLIDIYGLLTKCEVKMAGYWPNSFFANSQKKRTRTISSPLNRTSVVNKGRIYYMAFGEIFLAGRGVVPSGQDSSILPARVANHSAGFDSSCPFTKLAI